MTDGRSAIAINMFRMRPGISSEEFAEFSRSVDQPTCLLHEVVRRFDAYRVPTESVALLGADIVEVMEVSDWNEWVDVRDSHPSLMPVMSGFNRLVDSLTVRSALVVPIVRGV